VKFVSQKRLRLSRKVDECEPLDMGTAMHVGMVDVGRSPMGDVGLELFAPYSFHRAH
jgi:hypothetical protein